jgi:hypothetical protein
MVATQAVASEIPAVPIAAGGLIVAMAAVVDGPLSAVNLVSRRAHRWVDGASAAGLAIAAVILRDRTSTGSLVTLALAAVALGYLVVRADYRPKPQREMRSPQLRRLELRRRATAVDPTSPVSRGAQAEQLGRRAGRGAGRGARWVKRRIDERR